MSQFTSAETADTLGPHISKSVSYDKIKSHSPDRWLIKNFRQVTAISEKTQSKPHDRFSLLWDDWQGWLSFCQDRQCSSSFMHYLD